MKNTDSYLLLTSLRVYLLKVGCFGIVPGINGKTTNSFWDTEGLSALFSTPNIFVPTLSNCNSIKKTPCPPPPAYHTLSWIKISQFILQTKFTQNEFEYNVYHHICRCCLCYILSQIRCQIQGQSIFVLLRLSKLVLRYFVFGFKLLS